MPATSSPARSPRPGQYSWQAYLPPRASTSQSASVTTSDSASLDGAADNANGNDTRPRRRVTSTSRTTAELLASEDEDEDEDDDEDDADLSLPGRNPRSVPTTKERRRKQNRAAQRALRERKLSRLRDLEARAATQVDELRALQAENAQLRRANDEAQQLLAQFNNSSSPLPGSSTSTPRTALSSDPQQHWSDQLPRPAPYQQPLLSSTTAPTQLSTYMGAVPQISTHQAASAGHFPIYQSHLDPAMAQVNANQNAPLWPASRGHHLPHLRNGAYAAGVHSFDGEAGRRGIQWQERRD